ncbi:cysteine desulfurase [Dactylosporangium sp. CA-152071]|uniref:cysteine desulfurase n=1 Tax=Dactylosporangium sp. CA-152071 TaxID=3239933 RepID=UPI003D92AF1A
MTTTIRSQNATLNVDAVRADFPILTREVNGHPLTYLDSANTSQMPAPVLDRMREHLRRHNANAARSAHTLGNEATMAYEGARAKVAAFVGARTPDEVVFTKNSTEAINLVAHSFSASGAQRTVDERFALHPGDEIVVSEMEHHSNLVPWQLLCDRTGATLRWLPLTDEGRLDLSRLDELVNERTKLVSVVHMSNILGTVNPIAPIVARARAVGALILLDASQSVPHMPVDVTVLDADFVAFSGHKMCGPTGIGVLWGRSELLELMPPFLGGGSMIDAVSMRHSTYARPPARFEAGTPPILSAVGLGAAVDYLSALGMPAVHRHEQDLTAYALTALDKVPGMRVYGPKTTVDRGAVISFNVLGVDPVHLGGVLDSLGVQVRVGRHCAAPVCTRFGVTATTRASFYLYTTAAEIDTLVDGLMLAQRRTPGDRGPRRVATR